MSGSWEVVLKQFLHEWNKSNVDGNYDTLTRFYAVPEYWNEEIKRWRREREALLARGAKLVASRTKAVPLKFDQSGENQLDVSLSLEHEMEYIIEGIVHSHVNRNVQKVRLGRTGDEWDFLWPWSWYFGQQSENLNQKILPGEDIDQVEDVEQVEDEVQIKENGKENVKENVKENGKENGKEEHAKSNLPIEEVSRRSQYNGRRAAAYAETYWNSFNPEFKYFQEDDCTNFISQCLYAGGIPMHFTASRSTGWWYRGGKNPVWSYSWAVANSLYLLLRSGKAPFYAEQVEQPWQLKIGDIICYDFEGDGKWDHNTIVVMKDEDGMPLVDAHTHNSSQRYWNYTDSSAYTPNIKYAFFQIRG